MVKQMRATICAICTFIAIMGITCLLTTFSAHAEENNAISNIKQQAIANNGSLFIVGDSEDVEVTNVSEVVKSLKEELLTSSIQVVNSSKTPVTDGTRIEFTNQYAYCGPQTITIYEDVVTSEVRLMFERPYSDTSTGYFVYVFDKLHPFEDAKEAYETYTTELRLDYYGFTYVIYVKDDQFRIAKKWNPMENSNVYECDTDEADALITKLKGVFADGQDITVIEDKNSRPGKVHVFVNNKGQNEEYIFPCFNERPVHYYTEIIASIDILDDTYTIYVTDGIVSIDSAKRTASIDFSKSVK